MALVLCLSLCACGGNNEELEKYQKYETLINYLEAEDFENAYYELIKISQGAQSQENSEEEKKEPVTVNMLSLSIIEIRQNVFTYSSENRSLPTIQRDPRSLT